MKRLRLSVSVSAEQPTSGMPSRCAARGRRASRILVVAVAAMPCASFMSPGSHEAANVIRRELWVRRMSNEKLAQFANQKYLNLETYRKNGVPVATPLWFAEDDGLFYVYSLANAGKVKRIRNSSRARVTPCDVRGNPKGEWVDAEARIADQATATRGHQL